MELTNTYIPNLGIQFRLYCPIFLLNVLWAHQFVHTSSCTRPASCALYLFPTPRSLFFLHTNSPSRTHTHTHSLSHTHALSFFLFCSRSLSLAFFLALTLFVSLSCCLFLSFIRSLFLSLSRFALPHRKQRLINHYHFQLLSVCFALTGGHA